MFNNRQSRRRFRLGNLARLVHIRQSVSNQPPQPLPPRKTLEETLSQSPPQSPPFQSPQPQSPSFQPPPTQFPSSIPSPSTLSHVPLKSNSSPPSPLSPKSKKEPQSQPLQPPTSKPVDIHRSLIVHSPPQTPLESGKSQPHPLTSVPPPPLTPEANSLSPPPSTVNATEESQSRPFKSIDETRFRSPLPFQTSPPSFSESGESHPPLPPHEAKTPLSLPPTSTLNVNEKFKSQTSLPLLPSKSIDETQFRSPPPSLSESSKSQLPFPPPEVKTPPSTPKASKESQPQPPSPSKSINESRFRSSPPPQSGDSQPLLTLSETKIPPSPIKKSMPQPPPRLSSSKSIDETRLRSSPRSLSKSGESQSPLPPPNAKIPSSPPSTLNTTEESHSQPPLPLPPSKSINETRYRSMPPPIPPPEAKLPPSTLNITEESQSQPLPPSKSINETRFRSLPPSISPQEAKVPSYSPSKLKTIEESQSQPLPQSKSINETRFRSSPPSQEAKTPSYSPPKLNTTEVFKPQPPPQLPPSKSIDETQFLSQASPPSVSEPEKNQPPLPSSEAKIPPSLPSNMNAAKESLPQPSPPLMPSKSIDKTRSQSPPPPPPVSPPPPAKSIEEPKSTLPLSESDQQSISQTHSSPLLSPKASENLDSRSHLPTLSTTALTSPSLLKAPIPFHSPATITAPPLSSPPKSPSPLKSQIIPLPQNKPNNPIEASSPTLTNTKSHTSLDHNKDQNHTTDTLDVERMKSPEMGITKKARKNRGRRIWSEKNPVPVMIMMFINSNVQGINTSLSLDSSSIDHEPGVHLTIDYDQSCDSSSKVF